MNRPSSTITASGLVGNSISFVFLMLAIFVPEVYQRLDAYPGAEAVVAGFAVAIISTVAGYVKKENVLK